MTNWLSLMICALLARPAWALNYPREVEHCQNFRNLHDRAECLATIASSDILLRVVQEPDDDELELLYQRFQTHFGQPPAKGCFKRQSPLRVRICLGKALEEHLMAEIVSVRNDQELDRIEEKYRLNFVILEQVAERCAEDLLRRVRSTKPD